jgi:hypothetical protein
MTGKPKLTTHEESPSEENIDTEANNSSKKNEEVRLWRERSKIRINSVDNIQYLLNVEGGRTTPWTRFPTFQKPQG